jgi:hypothetical protein
LPTWWLISWQANHESKANPSFCGSFGGVWGRVLLLRRTLDIQGAAVSRQFFVGQSDSSEDCVQRFGILYPRRCNAFTHLSRLLAGGLCNGTIAARDHQPRVRGFAIWEPVLPTDFVAPSTAALGRIPDARAAQYWDRKRALSHLLPTESRVPLCFTSNCKLATSIAILSRSPGVEAFGVCTRLIHWRVTN